MIGNKLAHYTITGKLGEGGMGVVYEATDGHLGRPVALKILPHDAVSNPVRKQRFVQEAKTASALNHPNIVTIYDIDAADGIDYISMELIRGKTLEQLLSRGKLRLQDALRYGIQIADALAAAHAVGIVHRDLKPGNVMITERGDVKVLDFGLAKLNDDQDVSEQDETQTQHVVTEEGSVVGSVPYMSPEQAEGRKVDARSDIFSFGSVLYEMLTGKRAFRGSNRTATMAAILKDDPEPLSKSIPDVPREVERLVARCLRKDLDRRSQSMAEIRIALQELKEDSESGSLITSATATAAIPRRRPAWLYPGLAGVAIAAVLAVVWFSMKSQPVPTLKATVLTSFVGFHSAPSLSPDGNQFAFTWNGDIKNGKPHVYISLVGRGTPLRLTPEDEVAVAPSWSPGGQLIAYQRALPGNQRRREVIVMPALGGPARTIGPSGSGRVAWSPDEKWLVWPQFEDGFHSSLYIAPPTGGEVRRLLEGVKTGGLSGDFDAAFSPDGRRIAWCREISAYDWDLYMAEFQDGKLTGTPRRLTHDRTSKSSPVWTHDGKEIVYISGEINSELTISRINASGGEPRRIEGIGLNAANLTLASKSDRLLYSTVSTNFDIRRIDLTKADSPHERFLSSTRYEVSPSYSPDGKRIAFSSNRGGVRQIWVADADGSNPVALTSFSSGIAGSPKWSPDSQMIAFDARPEGNADIYTIPAAGGPVKRLTNDPAEDHVPCWSGDGKWIYFGSARAGEEQLFRMKPDGSGVQQVTKKGGTNCSAIPGGEWVYFETASNGVWKMPVDGGEPIQVATREMVSRGYGYTLSPKGIYLIGPREESGLPVLFHPLGEAKAHKVATLNNSPNIFCAVSPDDRYFLYTSADDPVYEIMQVEKFR